jgi:hypothetical protein
MGVTENAKLKPNVKEGAVGFSVTYVRANSTMTSFSTL